MHKSKVVFCAMSGGVDSSVAAALLKYGDPRLPADRQGFDVTGVFMRNWHAALNPGVIDACPWEEDHESARRAAQTLDIPFYGWDFSKEYKERVVKYMIDGYKAGETPNPDVMCNKEIKFGLFLKKAKRLGADYITTGHYVRLQNTKQQEYKLLAGVDKNKDQSYFLWTLTQAQLEYCLFPIGAYTKPHVRELAREFGLPNAERKDSQGICFIGKIDFPEFLANYIPSRKGAVLTTSGTVAGEHQGAHRYTIGQRHGIGIGGGEPYYIASKNPKENTVIVAHKNEPALYQKEIAFSAHNIIVGSKLELPFHCEARIRYRQPTRPCTILMEENKLKAVFDEPQRAVAPGQSIVFYKAEELIGGGVIV